MSSIPQAWAFGAGIAALAAGLGAVGAAEYEDCGDGFFVTRAPGNTYYVNGQTGSDKNPGTEAAPWQTVQKAIGTIKPGSQVLIAGGIYRVENLGFGPRGEGPARMTVFKAAPGARPVFSRPDDKCPQVGLDSYVRIQGLWFGGSGMRAGKTIFAPGSGNGGKEIIGCTIFGYEGGILIGTSFNLLLHGNRLVHCGSGHFSHGIYLSGGANPNCSHHVLVDRNVLVAGEGYGLHGWHAPMSMFLSRNVVAAHSYGIVMAGPDADTPYDGEDHVVVNNFVWKSKGATSGPNGLHCAGQNMIWENNLCGPNCRAIGNFGAATNQVQCNGFLGVAAVGKTPLAIGRAQMDAVLGVSEAAYDGAIAALDKAFNAPVEEIHKDTTIEQAFAQMWPRIPAGSPAHNYGPAWFGDLAKRVNLGPDTPAPLTKEAFWNAFRKLGRKDWERHARKSNQGPVVDAGPDQAVNASTATLNGSVTDSDGGMCKTVWAKLSGPGSVAFADASAPQTAVSFSAPGAYVLHLSADKGGPKDDGILYAGECVTITVQAGGGRVAEGGSRATTAGPPAAVDAKALETWRARLRERVQKGVQEGAQPRVSLTLLEAQPTAVKIARADAKGLTVIVGEGQLPVSWEQLGGRDYFSLALGFAKDDNAFDQVLAGVFLIAEGRGSDGEERLAKALLLDPKASAWVEEARTLLQTKK